MRTAPSPTRKPTRRPMPWPRRWWLRGSRWATRSACPRPTGWNSCSRSSGPGRPASSPASSMRGRATTRCRTSSRTWARSSCSRSPSSTTASIGREHVSSPISRCSEPTRLRPASIVMAPMFPSTSRTRRGRRGSPKARSSSPVPSPSAPPASPTVSGSRATTCSSPPPRPPAASSSWPPCCRRSTWAPPSGSSPVVRPTRSGRSPVSAARPSSSRTRSPSPTW